MNENCSLLPEEGKVQSLKMGPRSFLLRVALTPPPPPPNTCKLIPQIPMFSCESLGGLKCLGMDLDSSDTLFLTFSIWKPSIHLTRQCRK